MFNASLFAGYAFRYKKYSKYRKWTHCLFCEPLCYLHAVSFPVRDEVLELCDNLVASLDKIKLFLHVLYTTDEMISFPSLANYRNPYRFPGFILTA